MGPVTDFLFARPSFLGGVARVLDVGATLAEFNRSWSSSQANEVAHRTDWAIVGQAMAQFAEEHPEVLDEVDRPADGEVA